MRQGGNYGTWFVCVCVCVCGWVGLRCPWTTRTTFKSEFKGFQLGDFAENVSFVSYGMIYLLWKPVRFLRKLSLSSFREDNGNQFWSHPPGATTNQQGTMVRQSCEAKALTSCPCGLLACDIEVCANLYNCIVHFIILCFQDSARQAIAYRLHWTADVLYSEVTM